MTTTITELQVSRADLHTTRIAAADVSLKAGQALFLVEQFALTANNITYAAHGDDMGYWGFYPAAAGWGIVPVWGFARVVDAGGIDGLTVGDRIYGYWPLASHAVLEPAKVTRRGFVDAAAHRQHLASIYNSYQLVAGSDFGDERAYAIFRPLYTTSFLIDAWIAEEAATTDAVIISSASSKTALGLAQALKARGSGGPKVIGLTSAANRSFVESTGYYDVVTSYDGVAGLTADRPLFVDFAGSDAVRASVHQRFGGNLLASMVIGDTHWDSVAAPTALPGPRPTLFFAPTEAVKRMEAWGPAGFGARLEAAWRIFMASTGPWLRIVEDRGATVVEAQYHAILNGKGRADEGVVLSMAG
jgi:Protein of unknown function (DUF2855)